ncbi:helix-turn-helix domain-containing protein [Ensifer sp. NPDC090286]|uniref:helix-turn-helix domain-containing protein n=1 Tax=Ensifer sp. NPDC090286 TaxID=3363991 RepID=UPI00383A18EB|nr:DNA binding protein [Sinorhizobium phage StopSmel]
MHRPQRTDKPRDRSANKLEELASVKSKLLLAGFTLYDIDRRYYLPRGTAGTTLREPNMAGEQAIAAALGTKAHLLWPSRYQPSGQRRSPQPRENYERPPTMRQRQKKAGA